MKIIWNLKSQFYKALGYKLQDLRWWAARKSKEADNRAQRYEMFQSGELNMIYLTPQEQKMYLMALFMCGPRTADRKWKSYPATL